MTAASNSTTPKLKETPRTTCLLSDGAVWADVVAAGGVLVSNDVVVVEIVEEATADTAAT